jgi:pimeloyl-ACP methyl ester carboxylesterase
VRAPTALALIRPSVPCPAIAMFITWALMTGCSSSRELPPWFDQIQRLPVLSVTVEGQRLAYLDQGQGSTVVLLHGFGGSMWQWEYQQTELSVRHRVITLDLLGSGLSDKPDIDYRPDRLVASLRGFLDELGIERASLVGNSMGAGLAIAFALTYPDRVDRLVLIDGLPAGVESKLTSPLMKRAVGTRTPVWLAEFGNWLFGSDATERVLKEIVFDHTLLTPAVMERSKRNRRQTGVIRPLMSLRDHLPQWESAFAPRLHAISRPTLILWGEEDRLFPPRVGLEMQALIPHSTLHLIPNAGHIPQWEQPLVMNRHLLAFLES